MKITEAKLKEIQRHGFFYVAWKDNLDTGPLFSEIIQLAIDGFERKAPKTVSCSPSNRPHPPARSATRSAYISSRSSYHPYGCILSKQSLRATKTPSPAAVMHLALFLGVKK